MIVEVVKVEEHEEHCFICGKPLRISVGKDGSVHGGVFVADGYFGGGRFKGYWVCDNCRKELNVELYSD
ncbi:MAG: hypothetical protein ACP6IS_06925 [Candidatus Asgardarchaeia archaeon]